MAFIRKKGRSYYLVHNVREDGHVRQVHLACLGNRPRVSDETLEEVQRTHPQLQVDWEAVRRRAAETFVSPFSDHEGVEILLRSMRTLVQDLDELHLDQLRQRLRERKPDRDSDRTIADLLAQMEQLRDQLDRKMKHRPAAAPEAESLPASEHQDTAD